MGQRHALPATCSRYKQQLSPSFAYQAEPFCVKATKHLTDTGLTSVSLCCVQRKGGWSTAAYRRGPHR